MQFFAREYIFNNYLLTRFTYFFLKSLYVFNSELLFRYDRSIVLFAGEKSMTAAIQVYFLNPISNNYVQPRSRDHKKISPLKPNIKPKRAKLIVQIFFFKKKLNPQIMLKILSYNYRAGSKKIGGHFLKKFTKWLFDSATFP